MSDLDFNRNSVDATLARMEAKLDAALLTQALHAAELEDLKRWKWFSAGIGAAAGFILDKLVSGH